MTNPPPSEPSRADIKLWGAWQGARKTKMVVVVCAYQQRRGSRSVAQRHPLPFKACQAFGVENATWI